MLSRIRKFLHLKSESTNDDRDRKHMPFITGSQPWLKPFLLSALAHPPQTPALNAHYLQAITPVSARRELTVYDGRFRIPAVLSQSAASFLDADEDDTGVTTRNLLGHVLAPVDVIVVPDMTTTPPTATLLIKEIRVFADRIHQRPAGRVPYVYTDPEVCDALRAIVGRQLASYATATVLERADRATEIPSDDHQQTDAFFEKMLHDPSIPPSSLLTDAEPFAMDVRRGTVVGGGAVDDEHEPLAIIPEDPTPSEGDKSKDLQESPAQPDSQENQRDSEWDISFTQDPAEGGNAGNIGGDLPQTQHFALDEDDDDDDDDDNNENDDEKMKEDVTETPNDDVEEPTQDDGKSVGEQRIREIVGKAQDDTLDGQDVSQKTSPEESTANRNPANDTPPNQKSPVKSPKRASKSGEDEATEAGRRAVRTPPKRKRGTETRSGKGNPTEGISEPPESRRNPSAGSPDKASERKGREVHIGPSKQSSSSRKSPRRQSAAALAKLSTPPSTRSRGDRRRTTPSTGERESAMRGEVSDRTRTLEESPGRVTTSATKTHTAQVGGKANEGLQNSSLQTKNEGSEDPLITSPRRSSRVAEMKTPPRRPRNPLNLQGRLNEEEDTPETPLRRSSRLVVYKSPLQETPPHDPQSRSRRSPRVALKAVSYKEEESDNEGENHGNDKDDDVVMDPSLAANTAEEKSPPSKENQLLGKDSKPRSRRSSGVAPKTIGDKEEESDEKKNQDDDQDDDRGDDSVMDPSPAANTAEDETPPSEGKQPVSNNSKLQDAKATNQKTSSPEEDATLHQKREERGEKRKAPEISSRGAGSRKRQEREPSSHSPEPFLDKIRAEIEEMKRFRDRIDRNPDGYKAYPDGYLPSATPAKESVKRVLKFPPPAQTLSRHLDVPESAPM